MRPPAPRVSLRDDREGRLRCVRCGHEVEIADVDRMRWCSDCRRGARARATRRGWIVGAVVTMLVALWLWVAVRPSGLVPGGWLATLVAALWIVSKVAREVFHGVERMAGPARSEQP